MSVAFGHRRIAAVDAMRGLIMVLMALDHASYFIAKTHSIEFWGTAMPVYDAALPFLLRAVSHLCAPGFFLLMGVGMTLFAGGRSREGWGSLRIARFFLIRGLLLIGVQQVLENPAWFLGSMRAADGAFTFRGGPIPGGGGSVKLYLGILYGLGSSMVVWAFMARWPSMAVLAVSLAAIGVTQVWVFTFADPLVLYPPLVRMLLIPGHTGPWIVFYPTIPWMGMTGLGVVLGRLLIGRRVAVSRGLWATGFALLGLFLGIRLFAGTGGYPGASDGWIAFFSLIKYPPEMAFLVLTTGINLLLLRAWMLLESGRFLRTGPITVFGQSPLFFYIAHLYLYALMGWAFPQGMRLAHMMPFWLAGLVILYPLCVAYGRFKRSRPIDSLWRLF